MELSLSSITIGFCLIQRFFWTRRIHEGRSEETLYYIHLTYDRVTQYKLQERERILYSFINTYRKGWHLFFGNITDLQPSLYRWACWNRIGQMFPNLCNCRKCPVVIKRAKSGDSCQPHGLYLTFICFLYAQHDAFWKIRMQVSHAESELITSITIPIYNIANAPPTLTRWPAPQTTHTPPHLFPDCTFNSFAKGVNFWRDYLDALVPNREQFLWIKCF